MIREKYTQQIWILLAESFSSVVSDLSQPLWFVKTIFFCRLVFDVQSSCTYDKSETMYGKLSGESKSTVHIFVWSMLASYFLKHVKTGPQQKCARQNQIQQTLVNQRRAGWYTASTVVKTSTTSSWSIVYLTLRRGAEIRDSELSHLPCYCIVRPLAYRSLITTICIDNLFAYRVSGTPRCASSDMKSPRRILVCQGIGSF